MCTNSDPEKAREEKQDFIKIHFLLARPVDSTCSSRKMLKGKSHDMSELWPYTRQLILVL